MGPGVGVPDPTVGVPAALTAQVPATEVLDRVLTVTGGRGGGNAAFAQGGGAHPDDLPDVVARIWAVMGLAAPAPRFGRGAARAAKRPACR